MAWRRQKRLQFVSEAQSEGRTREIYHEIKQALGIPQVHPYFQALAAHPRLLELYWAAAKPVIESQEFFGVARRLGADAYTRVHNYFRIPDLGSAMRKAGLTDAAMQELTTVVELYHYTNAPLLLLVAEQMLAFDGSCTPHGTCTQPADHPVFSELPISVEEHAAPAPTRRIYEEMKHLLGCSFVPADYCALARWPDFLHAYWSALRPIARSPLYQQSQHGIRQTALSLVDELPATPQLTLLTLEENGVDEEGVTYAVHVTERFLQLLSSQIMNVALARIGLDGGNEWAEAKPERSTAAGMPIPKDIAAEPAA